MSTRIVILASLLLVAAELAVSVANRDRIDMAARAEQVEERLDTALHAWVDRTFGSGQPGPAGGQVADAL
jgi:hypothetical protein